ncbi:MAG TPA: DUF1592 domain-containing protein [Chthoniobacter sp.]
MARFRPSLPKTIPAAKFTVRWAGAVVVAWMGPGLIVAAPAATATQKSYGDQFRPLFDQYCAKCHSGDKPKGDWRVEELGADFSDAAVRDRWQSVLEKLEAGEMPPKAKPRPSEQETHTLTDWIASRVGSADAQRRVAQGRVVLRRLNRAEYENTVRDLLGVNTSLRDILPLDTSADGFDNVGDALHTSSFLLERYLEAADAALNQAIVNRAQPPAAIHKHYSLKETHQVKSPGENVFRKSEGESVVLLSSSPWQAVSLSPFYPTERGYYRFRMSASAVQSAGKPVTFRVWSGSGGMGGAKGHLVSYFDAPADQPQRIEFVDYMEPKTTISILPYGLASSQTVNKVGAEAWTEPGLVIDWVEVEGPINDLWPPASHRRIFGDLPQGPAPGSNSRDRVEVISQNPQADADRILRRFMPRAFRRPVTDADVQPYAALVANALQEKQTFEQAVRVGLTAVMTAPDFLFLREKPGRLDDFALASRLSYFLWSSMPDDELLAAAESGHLHEPANLRTQVERMLQSPKASAFTENFTGQWLGLRDIDFTMPSHILYPDFDDMLKESMIRETQLFFDEVLKNDLSLTNFIASDFSMLNGRLARHYGIPGVDGWEFRKVPLPPGSHRGGVLTMASVLKVTANGTNTSPVLRGAWVLDRILGTPPPRPPPNVAALVPDIRGATTIRQQLAKHRTVEMCAGCHAKIDPAGFALENFDVIGGWRDNYRSSGNGKPVFVDGRKMSYLVGLKVDSADTLADGRSFKDIDEFKQLLLTDKDQIARALTIKLLTYATGGPPERADRPKVDAIVAQIRTKNYGFRSLVEAIVASDLFQTK